MLFDPDFSDGVISADAYCFAGLEDDLVIGGSEDGDMFVWSLPNGRGRDGTINRSRGVTICTTSHNAVVLYLICDGCSMPESLPLQTEVSPAFWISCRAV